MMNLSQSFRSLKCFVLLVSLFEVSGLKARDITVTELGEGACLMSFNKEELKVASFNDKTSFMTTLRLLDFTNSELITNSLGLNKNKSYKSLSYALHCSSIGASVIIRSKMDDQTYCSWLYIKEGKFAARSIGLVVDDKNERLACEGVVPLELIVAFRKAENEDFFNEFNSLIDQKIPISKTMVKLVLKKEYLGKEMSVMDEFKKSGEVKFIELNNYQHPIGDVLELK